MEKARRDKLRSVVGEARRLIEDSLTRQLAGYGLRVDTDPVPRQQLSLRPEQEAHYVRVLDAVKREGRATGATAEITREAVGRHVREAGGTWINRIAALRALEARKLLDPAAAFVSDDYGDLSPRANRLREVAAEQGRSLSADEALRAGIEDACRELSASVRVLFDLSDEHSLFWPDKTALKKLLQLFSVDVTADDWSQPDVLGWVYQYYNTEANAELKRRKKRTTGFKLQPDDIPIANQFYTPNWVVRVLADNTLGRLWLEMQERQPQLESTEETVEGKKETRWHLVERRRGIPHAATDPEGFKAWIAEEPNPLRDATVDRLCRFLAPLPSRPPPRGRKSVRELKIIDPACGSGHFLLYAFDILFAMYREGEPGLDPRQIPALILENNLFGIDIDVRAAQLAAFDLYLKARTVLAALDAKARLEIRRLNIVVADAHLGDDPRKEAFLARYNNDPLIQHLYRKILADVDHTNVLGSLLKVRTEFEAVFREIRTTNTRNGRERQGAWAHGQLDLIATAPQRELTEIFTSTLGREWTLDELLSDLQKFESEVLPKQDVGARLFYTDLRRTVGLLGLLSQKYDVILMNQRLSEGKQEKVAHPSLSKNISGLCGRFFGAGNRPSTQQWPNRHARVALIYVFAHV
jgi:hypothetical protein